MIKKIISGGQTGAARAALDVAIELNIPHGGWIPRGRQTEEGRLPDKYHLKEISSISYPQRTELNVVDSDGTLVISHGGLTGDSTLVQRLSKKHRRPCLHIDLTEMNLDQAAAVVGSWIDARKIETLNVGGSRASRDPKIYEAVKTLLKAVMNLYLPRSVEEAVDRLTAEIPLKDRTIIANMDEGDLSSLHSTVGVYIRRQFGLLSGNSALTASCGATSGRDTCNEHQASATIIHELWKRLQKTHTLRVLR